MKKNRHIIVLLGAIFLLTSCGNDPKKVVAVKQTPMTVKVSTITKNNNKPFLNVSGKIQSVNSADLSTRMMGFVSGVHVHVGDEVRKGQLLISINNVALKAKRAQVNASITEATTAFTNAKKNYNRFSNLFRTNSASQKELDDVTAHFEMTKARLEAANQMKNEINAEFAYSNITSPFNAVITGKYVKKGDMANVGVPLISVEAPGYFEVITMIPETKITSIKNGNNVDVVVKSMNKTIKGQVTEISASAKNTGGQYLAKITLNKTSVPILSGMFVTVQFPIENQKQRDLVLIPKDVIVTKGQLSGVYTVSHNNTALLRWLRLGRTYGDAVEVLSGLSVDESYIVSAEGKLFNGVKIIPTASLSSQKAAQ